MTSHGRLLLFIEKYNDPNVLARVYLKVQLVSLCEAYEVNFRRSDTKKNLANAIIGALRNHTSIPFIAPVDDRQYQVVETETDATNGSVRMRFRLSEINKKYDIENCMHMQLDDAKERLTQMQNLASCGLHPRR